MPDDTGEKNIGTDTNTPELTSEVRHCKVLGVSGLLQSTEITNMSAQPQEGGEDETQANSGRVLEEELFREDKDDDPDLDEEKSTSIPRKVNIYSNIRL